MVADTVSQAISMTKTPKDHMDDDYYTYVINGSQNKYQLMAYLENNDLITYNFNNKVYALADYTSRYKYFL